MTRFLVLTVMAFSLSTCTSGPSRPPDPPEPSAPNPPAAAKGSCYVRYSPETLKQREFAFDGTAVAIGRKRYEGPEGGEDRGTATFRVNRWFKGGEEPEVTLESGLPAQNGVVTSVEGADVKKGGRYLVAGDGKFMGACGFTRDWSEVEAAEWETALRD
ncbi:MAG TPA: hypothetical protein VND22_06380 [Actinomycetota bacterium]|nr:hypothetical protein [Actinomycetota bacterium]